MLRGRPSRSGPCEGHGDAGTAGQLPRRGVATRCWLWATRKQAVGGLWLYLPAACQVGGSLQALPAKVPGRLSPLCGILSPRGQPATSLASTVLPSPPCHRAHRAAEPSRGTLRPPDGLKGMGGASAPSPASTVSGDGSATSLWRINTDRVVCRLGGQGDAKWWSAT